MSNESFEKATAIEDIDCHYLNRLINEAGFEGTVLSFSSEPVSGNSHGGGLIIRFTLRYTDESSPTAPRTLILKQTRQTPSQALDPAFARREVDGYQNQLFRPLYKKLYIPKAYHLVSRPDIDQYWIWMEDLGEETFQPEWKPATLVEMVRNIAEFHASWWGRTEEMKRMNFLRFRAQAMYDGLWVDRIAQNCSTIETHTRASLISQVFTPERRNILMKLSRAADVIYPKLEALPQTLLHHDIWPPNLGIKDGKTVLIDWSYVGQGTPGADLSQTVALLFQMWGPDFDDEELLQALWTGLKEEGISIPYEEIAAGYELAFCLRPAHALGGPVLGGIVSGRNSMVGSDSLEGKLASAEAALQRIERGIRRL